VQDTVRKGVTRAGVQKTKNFVTIIAIVQDVIIEPKKKIQLSWNGLSELIFPNRRSLSYTRSHQYHHQQK